MRNPFKHPPRIGTVALVVRDSQGKFELIESLSDDAEIETLESALEKGQPDPLASVQRLRQRIAQEDEEFGDYIEELLSQPTVRPEIREHGLKWLRSKMRIEQFQRSEREATEVIAQFAFRVFSQEPERRDFLLAGPNAQVRVRVLTVQAVSAREAA
jgi:hypothetical protein